MMRRLAVMVFLLAFLHICGNAFADRSGLPDSLKTIGDEAFAGTALDIVDLPEGITGIGENAFAGSSLTDINLPSSLVSIADNAFEKSVGFTYTKNTYAYHWLLRNGFLTPQNLTISLDDDGNAHISWDAVAGIAEYYLYFSKDEPFLSPDTEMVTVSGGTEYDALSLDEEEFLFVWVCTDTGGALEYPAHASTFRLSSIDDILRDEDNAYSLYYDVSLLTPVTTDTISDPDQLQAAVEYNANLETYREMIDDYTDQLDALKAKYIEYMDVLEAVFPEGPNSPYVFRFDDETFTISGDMVDNLGAEYTLVSTNYDEDIVQAQLTNAAGDSIYILMDGSSAVITAEPAISSKSPESQPAETPAGPPRIVENVQKLLNAMDIYEVAIQEFIEMTGDALKDLQGLPSSQYTQNLITWANIAAPMVEMISAGNQARQILDSLAELSQGMTDDVLRYQQLIELAHHDHSTVMAEYEEAEYANREMNRLAETAMRLLGFDMVNNGIQITFEIYFAYKGAANKGLSIPTELGMNLAKSLGKGKFKASADDLYQRVKNYDDILHYHVIGTVKEKETGNVIPYVYVTQERDPETYTIDSTPYQKITGENGVIQFYPLEPAISLKFEKEGYEELSVDLPKDGGEIEYAIAYPFTVEMERKLGTVTGTVIDKDTREPIEGAVLTYDTYTAETDEEGSFSIDIPVTSEAIQIKVEKEKYVTGYTYPTSVPEKPDHAETYAELEAYFLIETREDLELIRTITSANKFLVVNDIDMGTDPFVPLPKLQGIFNGGGFSISNMVIDGTVTGSDNNERAGLFESLDGGQIMDLTLYVTITGSVNDRGYIGGLAGDMYNNGSVSSCNVHSTITINGGEQYTGGGIGRAFSGQLENVSVWGTVTVNSDEDVYVGGAVGSLEGAEASAVISYANVGVQQSAANHSGSVMWASSLGIFSPDLAEDCQAFGSLTLETIDSEAHGFGVQNVERGNNYSKVTVKTQSGTANAAGCDGGSECGNYGDVTAQAVGTGNAKAAGIMNSGGGNGDQSSEVDIKAITVSGKAEAYGGLFVADGASNLSSVRAESVSGNAQAWGMYAEMMPRKTGCTNSGTVSAYSESGNAESYGLAYFSGSTNTAGVSASSMTGNSTAIGLYACVNDSTNSGNVLAESDEWNSSAYGSKECEDTINNGIVKSIGGGENSSAKAYGASSIGYSNVNNGNVEARTTSEPGEGTGGNFSAMAVGVEGSDAENNGVILAAGYNASAMGVGGDNSFDSMNTSNVSAVGSYTGRAYGFYAGQKDNSSSGIVFAQGDNFAGAYNSSSVSASSHNRTISAEGNVWRRLLWSQTTGEIRIKDASNENDTSYWQDYDGILIAQVTADGG